MRNKLIGLAGRAGSGKDVAASYLAREQGFEHYKFSAPLKRMIAALVGETEQGVEEVKDNLYAGFTIRRLMQTLGTEWGRETLDPDFWVNQFAYWLVGHSHRDIVISDVRFDNEAEEIRRRGGRVIEIVRPNLDAIEAHVSEEGISPHLIDARVYNDSDIKRLEVQVDLAVHALPGYGRIL